MRSILWSLPEGFRFFLSFCRHCWAQLSSAWLSSAVASGWSVLSGYTGGWANVLYSVWSKAEGLQSSQWRCTVWDQFCQIPVLIYENKYSIVDNQKWMIHFSGVMGQDHAKLIFLFSRHHNTLTFSYFLTDCSLPICCPSWQRQFILRIVFKHSRKLCCWISSRPCAASLS